MTNPIKPSQVEHGFYYEKKNAPGWLRLILHRRGDEVVYADFTGLGTCWTSTLSRWACAKYNAAEAAKLFPKEVADIAKIVDGLPASHRLPASQGGPTSRR